jgi:hypothetical protein
VTATARGAGLALHPAGSIPPDLLAALRTHKAEVLALLLPCGGGADPLPLPPAPELCACGGRIFWTQAGGGRWHCRRCTDDAPATAWTALP